jgi:RNA polymerase sigma-70 factor (ECF subfamily)
MSGTDDPGYRPSLGREALAHADALFNLARYLTGSDSDGEDLVQETYARALAGAQRFHGGNLKAWLFKILRNTFIDVYRREKHNPVRGGLDTIHPSVEPPTEEELLRDDLEVHQLRNVVASDIETALMKLGEEARTVILLDLEGLSEVEVADVVGCAVGTVKSRLSRARVALRQQL